ncbi:ATP-binding protein [Solirubrobacter soli]|uniref:ATP-binding protein n=1 Tax=Solirubrobacter soli TaxID=363832 RepID=UPI00042A75BF|nr:LuxR family transcriptional regulator [Solirubrobacter soli]
MTLVGRARELRRLHDLQSVLPQRGGALLLRGEPGIGKSALLSAAAASAAARGLRVLRATGVQSEARLPFAGLHQLLFPVIDHLETLGPPQRHAVLAAFGMTDREPPDLFLIALATLNVLSEVATDAPVVIVAEDAHWLDRSSLEVLAFVARRLESEPILILGAIRDGFDGGGFPEVRIEGLDEAASAELLDSVAPGLEPAMRARLLAEAAGNPLALVELPLASAQLRPGTLLPAWLPLTARLEHAFAAQVGELPEGTRRLLLVAALNDGASLSEALTADKNVLGALEPAIAAKLVSVEADELRFRHPLVRSAIRQAASVQERHAAHAALAAVVDLDRRVWHRAASVVGPDETTAAELEWTAAAAERRGSLSVAVSAFTRAAELSDHPARRGARLLRAAELAFELGRSDVVVGLLRDAEPLELSPGERTRLAWLRELFATQLWSGTARTAALIGIADRMRIEGDPERALRWLRNVAFRCWWSYPDEDAEALVLQAAARMPVAPDHPELIDTLALAAPVERGREVIAALARRPLAGDADAAFSLGDASTAVGAFSAELIAEAITGLRAQGRVSKLTQALVSQAWASLFLGSWDVGLHAAEEAVGLAGETRQPRLAVAAALAGASLRALRGEDGADAAADDAERVLLPMGASPLLSLAQLTRGIGALGEGRHADAFAALRRIYEPGDVAHHRFIGWWAFVDHVDAAIHSDRHGEARALVARFEPVLEQTGAPLLAAGMTYARAVLSDEEALFAVPVDGHPLIRARLLLAYGAWLRRRRRLADSRGPLRAAREAFDALGAVRWGERARQELRASGETSRRRTPDAWDELTPQELQIAQMAAAGLTNREIGERLYLSHRTIGSHLYRIFPKLGVTSRAELRDAVG